MFDFGNIMGKVKEMQAKVKEAQENLGNVRVSAEAGAGMVKAVANGKKQLVSIEIDPSLMGGSDQEMLQDLIVAAANKALTEAEEVAQAEIQRITKGVLPNIPGLNLDAMM